MKPMSAGVAVLATILAACNSSDTMTPGSGGPPVTQAEAQAIGQEMQGEVEAMTSGATVTDFMSPSFPAPPEALHAFRGPLSFFPNADCPTLSQNPPDDTDQDGVPDNLVLTFNETLCTFTHGGASMVLSGTVTISDPTSVGQGLRIVFGAFQQKTTFQDAFFLRSLDGPWQLTSDATGFAAADSTTATHESSLRPTATLAKAWQVNFVADQGSTFSRHARLPSGVFTIKGSTSRTFDTSTKKFSVVTADPLHRDITCDSPNKIVSGELDIEHSGPHGSATITIVFNGCGVDPTVTVVTGPTVS
jgi:hypothetical protein